MTVGAVNLHRPGRSKPPPPHCSSPTCGWPGRVRAGASTRAAELRGRSPESAGPGRLDCEGFQVHMHAHRRPRDPAGPRRHCRRRPCQRPPRPSSAHRAPPVVSPRRCTPIPRAGRGRQHSALVGLRGQLHSHAHRAPAAPTVASGCIHSARCSVRARSWQGSDWSVSSVNPLHGVQVAVSRRALDAPPDAPSWLPKQRLDLPIHSGRLYQRRRLRQFRRQGQRLAGRSASSRI